MSDLISRQEAIDIVSGYAEKFNGYIGSPNDSEVYAYARGLLLGIERNINAVPSAQIEQRWIPVTTRPMDEEERKEWSEKLGYDIEYDEALIYNSQLPDDGQEVLVCGRYGRVWVDTFENDTDYGCCFEEHGDMDGIVAWMPLPPPYKGERKEDETD